MLDILISIITITYMYLMSRKRKSGLYVGVLAQFVWVAFIYDTKSWGLIPLNAALWWILLSGIVKWDDAECRG